MDGIDYAHKENFKWISVIRLPDFVTKEDYEWTVEEATKKKKTDFSRVEFFTYDEGECVRNLSKTDVLSIASKLSELRPDVVKEVIAQFPEFVKLIQSSMSEYKDILGDIISSNDESIKQVYATADKELNISSDSRKQFYDFAEKVHADLSKCLDNPQLSAEEREAILEKEMEILKTVSKKDTEIRSQETETARMVDKKDSEKRQFNWGIVKVASSVLIAGLVEGVSVLGGNVNIKLPKK